MSVEDPEVVDFIGTDKATGRVVLTISDHLPWNNVHFSILEKKISKYVDFVNSGQLLEKRPDAEGKPVEISIAFKHELSDEAERILKAAQEDIQKLGLILSYHSLEELR
jgi:hypothetical protein